MGTKQVSVKLYPDQREHVEEIQETHNVSQSEAMRRLVQQGAERPSLRQYLTAFALGLVLIVTGSVGILPYSWAQYWSVAVFAWLLYEAWNR
jgi:hypothetical protein